MAQDTPVIARSVVIAAPADALYDMLADVTRMGEWSPACTGATWDEGAGPTAAEGAWFTGHNTMGPDRSYDTRCEITAAERPRVVAWMQNGRDKGLSEWRYELAETDGSTEVTETWRIVNPSPNIDATMLERMQGAFGTGIEQTLATLKAAAES